MKKIETLNKHNFKRLMELNELLEMTDHEFCPPLSKKKPIHEHMTEYLEGQESKIIISDDDKMISAILYYYTSDHLHVDGLVTHPEWRNLGLGQLLYEKVELMAKEQGYKGVSLVTWSTNVAQLHILNKRGYQKRVQEGERCSGVSTVYLWKDV